MNTIPEIILSDELVINSKNFHNSFYVCGETDDITTLLSNITIQCKNHNLDVEMYGFTPATESKSVAVTDLLDIITNYKKIANERLEKLKSKNVSNIYELDEDIPTKILIINQFDLFLWFDDGTVKEIYKIIDGIKTGIIDLVYLGETVGIKIILGLPRPSTSYISSSVNQQLSPIIVGNVHTTSVAEICNMPYFKVLPNYALIKFLDGACATFNIDNVKNF